MFRFDLSQEPLTNLELKEELQSLKGVRKIQIKYSCISDILHAFVFIGLYFSHYLSGYAALTAVVLSTVVALTLAMTSRDNLKLTNQFATGVLSFGTAITTTVILTQALKEPFSGSLVAGLATGSIVVVGATLGRQIKRVMATIEAMKPIIDDVSAQQELTTLCRKYTELDEYREKAAQYLRPHLTYGELAAMRKWTENQQSLHS